MNPGDFRVAVGTKYRDALPRHARIGHKFHMHPSGIAGKGAAEANKTTAINLCCRRVTSDGMSDL